MTNSSKNRKVVQRKRERSRSKPNAASETSSVQLAIHREIRHITLLAQAEESRIVAIGCLVLFSTQTRDAWLLDSEDHFALCLCRDGEPQPFRIIDAPDTVSIDWQARFEIEGGAFVVQERSGRVVAIHGYPTAEISAACRGV
jgi:hypothetical protein